MLFELLYDTFKKNVSLFFHSVCIAAGETK